MSVDDPAEDVAASDGAAIQRCGRVGDAEGDRPLTSRTAERVESFQGVLA